MQHISDRNKIYQGNALNVLKSFSKDTIDLAITSPPYWGLRNYGEINETWDGDPKCDHEFTKPEKAFNSSQPTKWNTSAPEIWNGGTSKNCMKCGAWQGSLGLEPDYNLYIEHLCQIFDEVKRVIKPEGSLYVNIGDTYSGAPVSGKWGGGFQGKFSRDKADISNVKNPKIDIQEKSLVGIPFRFAIEMINRNWILRNTIIWHKHNCMPHSVKDRFTVDFEYIFFFTKQTRYYFEQQFEPYKYPLESMSPRNLRPNGMGRNKRTVWPVNTSPYMDAHFAVYPEELLKTPIKAGCPKEICSICGKPKMRKYKLGEIIESGGSSKWDEAVERKGERAGIFQREVLPDGYTECGCNAKLIPGIVLDPFMGSGTTGSAAKKLGRDYIGIEQNPKYIKIAENRISKAYEQRELFEL